MRILIIEDEQVLAHTVAEILEKDGFETEVAFDGGAGLTAARSQAFDLIICDVMMPVYNGYEVVKKLREEHIGTPVIMLTARTQIEDRVEGLDAGADYYIPKPFDIRELLACIHAVLRRQGPEVNEITFGDLSLDLETATLRTETEQVSLSAREFDVMRILLSNGEKYTTKQRLLKQVWGTELYATPNNVEVYVGFLRRKLASISSCVEIKSTRGLGYRLEMKAENTDNS